MEDVGLGSEGQHLHGTTQFGDESPEVNGTEPICILCWEEGTYTPLTGHRRHYTCRKHSLLFSKTGGDVREAFERFMAFFEDFKGLPDAPLSTVIYRKRPPDHQTRKDRKKTSVGRSKACPVRLRR